MTTILTIALATFLAGLYLGHRIATRRWATERAQLERQYQRVLDHVDDYIEANAAGWGVFVDRNPDGHIIGFTSRCGTPGMWVQEARDCARRRKALH